MTNKDKFCVDCTWFRETDPKGGKCYHPLALHKTDIVYGEKFYHTAYDMRMGIGGAPFCGLTATLFTKKGENH